MLTPKSSYHQVFVVIVALTHVLCSGRHFGPNYLLMYLKVWGSRLVFLPTTSATLLLNHPRSHCLPSCTCLQQAAVGGRVLAVTGTFQERSHPINPLSLGPRVHNAPHPHPPPLQVLFSLLHHHQHPSKPPRLSQTRSVKGIHCENKIKGVSPTCMLTISGTEVLIPRNIPE